MLAASQPEIVTLGCRLNIAESEAIRRLVAGRDIAVVNGCGVTNRAVKETRAAIRRLRRARPSAELVVTGCASEMEPAAFAAMPEVDRIVGNAAKLLPASWGVPANTPAPVRHTRGFVAVQTGCDHACTFCAIPQGRGVSRSDPIGDIVLRIAQSVERGQREVVLSGVDLASYDDHGAPLSTLVGRVLRDVPRLERLRLSSLDPAAIDDALFVLLTQEPRVMPHVHLSLQSGDDLILKRMRRRHTRAESIRLIERLKAARDIAIGADLIAGFPTESDAAFANTLALLDDGDIVHAHIFPYSPRAGTPAARMPQVSATSARDRAAELREAAADRRAAWLATLIGTTQHVLIEKPGDRGHTPGFAEVRMVEPARPLPPNHAELFEACAPYGSLAARPSTSSGRTGDVVPLHITADHRNRSTRPLTPVRAEPVETRASYDSLAALASTNAARTDRMTVGGIADIHITAATADHLIGTLA